MEISRAGVRSAKVTAEYSGFTSLQQTNKDLRLSTTMIDWVNAARKGAIVSMSRKADGFILNESCNADPALDT